MPKYHRMRPVPKFRFHPAPARVTGAGGRIHTATCECGWTCTRGTEAEIADAATAHRLTHEPRANQEPAS